jgi:hypothetical protein
VQLVHDRGFADAGVAGYQHELRRATGNDPLEGFEERLALQIAPIQLLRNQQPVRGIAENKWLDAS